MLHLSGFPAEEQSMCPAVRGIPYRITGVGLCFSNDAGMHMSRSGRTSRFIAGNMHIIRINADITNTVIFISLLIIGQETLQITPGIFLFNFVIFILQNNQILPDVTIGYNHICHRFNIRQF